MNFSESVLQSIENETKTPQLKAEIEKIASHIGRDLHPPVSRYFSIAVEAQIHEKAAQNLVQALRENRNVPEAWQIVVTDFHRSRAWGFPTISQPEKRPLTAEQKQFRELASYIGFAVVILFIVKSAFYIFGMLGANYQDDPLFTYGFWISLALLVAVSVAFGWKKFKDAQ
jgi:hypothetical protein